MSINEIKVLQKLKNLIIRSFLFSVRFNIFKSNVLIFDNKKFGFVLNNRAKVFT